MSSLRSPRARYCATAPMAGVCRGSSSRSSTYSDESSRSRSGYANMIVERLLKIALLGSSWVLYVLLGLSVLSLTAALERWLFFRRHHDDPVALKKKLIDSFGSGDLKAADEVLGASPSVEARVVRAGIKWAHGGSEAVSDAIESELATAKAELEKSTNLLGTLGNNAPFIGLFGTVIGVIEAF